MRRIRPNRYPLSDAGFDTFGDNGIDILSQTIETQVAVCVDKLHLSPLQHFKSLFNVRAFGELGLTGDEPEPELIERMAEHPTLLQRPIGVKGDRAVVGRPPEELLKL